MQTSSCEIALGQFQWARRFSERGNQFIFRTDLQLVNDSLLPLEQYAVGGINTVRGYRENELVRDECWITSLELRIPVFRLALPGISHGSEQGMVQIAPFVDYGKAWNKSKPTLEPESIYSIGLGLRWEPSPKVHAQLYWGHAFRGIDHPEHDLQDDGLHFNLQLAYQ